MINNPPSVAVILCCYNSEKFLQEQIQSIDNQTWSNLTIWASDDGSYDKTHELLQHYQKSLKKQLIILEGPQKGYAANFISSLGDSNIQADYFAYADQDDIWEQDKLTRAISKLSSVEKNIPAIYCSRTSLINENGQCIGLSPLFQKAPSFANALVQNIGGGNTMVFNKAARELLRAANKKSIVSHDWWTYILVAGAGGSVFYDTYPSVQYRQHNNNLVGANSSWLARLSRIFTLLKGGFRTWNTIHIQALNEIKELLTPENQQILKQFCNARDNWLIPRLFGMWKCGVYRQTIAGNIGLIVATLLKKI